MVSHHSSHSSKLKKQKMTENIFFKIIAEQLLYVKKKMYFTSKSYLKRLTLKHNAEYQFVMRIIVL